MTNNTVQTKKTVSLYDHIETTLTRVRQELDAVNLNRPNGEELWDELRTAENALMNALVQLHV